MKKKCIQTNFLLFFFPVCTRQDRLFFHKKKEGKRKQKERERKTEREGEGEENGERGKEKKKRG